MRDKKPDGRRPGHSRQREEHVQKDAGGIWVQMTCSFTLCGGKAGGGTGRAGLSQARESRFYSDVDTCIRILQANVTGMICFASLDYR